MRGQPRKAIFMSGRPDGRPTRPVPDRQHGGARVTFVWFVIWLIANNVGANEPLQFDPVNFWAAALVLAVAIDLNRPRPELGADKA
jgi:hypothetical protein